VVEAPSALIWGGDNFVAKKLGELLVSRGITVFWDDDAVGRPLYCFDFSSAVAGLARYQEMREKRVKICRIGINPSVLQTAPLDRGAQNIDMRLVNLHDVYGVGINNDEWWFVRAVDLAARNKNLILPKYGQKFRLLAVDDACEAIMRAVIMSGTAGKTFEIAGNEIESKEVATVLIDLAKMTKTTIHEIGLNPPRPPFDKGGEEYLFENSARALRWKLVVEFREGIKEVVAEAVARVDEEQRNEHRAQSTEHRGEKVEAKEERVLMRTEVEEEPKKNFQKEKEIVVEEEENNFQFPISNFQKEKKEEKEIVVEEEVIEKVREKPKIKYYFPWKWVGMGVGVVILVIGLVYGWFLWGVVMVAKDLGKPIKLLEEKRIDEAKKMILKNQTRNKNMAGFWAETKLGEIVEIFLEVSEIEEKLVTLVESMDKINGAIFEEKVIDFKAELTNVSKNLLEVETEVGIVQARLMGVRKWMPGRWRPDIDKGIDMVSKNIDLVSKLRQLTGVLPEILGLDGKRREYLVLLQNEMELRATGGFIGSYGVLSFQEGRLISFDIKDVYEADGQLRGHVEPPEEIKRYLGEAGWFMRDANWKASFPQSAKDVQWFFEKEMGRKVDGVIGVDLAVVKSMLNATGPIFVPDFKEKIDKDNLYEQAEFYSESKFFPGSVQKASFLSGLGKQLFMEISDLKMGQRWNLARGLVDVLEKNDLQMAFNEPIVAEVVGDLGWDGEVFLGNCGLSDCYGDYLYVVESNLGVNKANYFLYRSIEQKIDIKEMGVERILRINYENLAKSTSWPGGDYKNYLRIYVPKDVQVTEVTMMSGGQKQNVALNEVKMTNVYNKRELGFLVTVPISKKVVVEVKYASSYLQMKEKFSYMLYIQRQSGFGDTGLVDLVSMPTGWQPMQVTPSASVVGGKLLFNQKLDKDIRLGVEISK